MSQPNQHRVSIRQAVALDLTSFVVGIVVLYMVATLLTLVVLVPRFGGPTPRESPAELLLGFVVGTSVVLAFLRYRMARISDILNRGEVVAAQVVRGLHFQLFVQLLLQIPTPGGVVQRKLWLPNTIRPRALTRMGSVLVCLSTRSDGAVLVRSLYLHDTEPPPGAGSRMIGGA